MGHHLERELLGSSTVMAIRSWRGSFVQNLRTLHMQQASSPQGEHMALLRWNERDGMELSKWGLGPPHTAVSAGNLCHPHDLCGTPRENISKRRRGRRRPCRRGCARRWENAWHASMCLLLITAPRGGTVTLSSLDAETEAGRGRSLPRSHSPEPRSWSWTQAGRTCHLGALWQTFLRLPLSAGSAGAVLGTFYVLAQVSLNSLAKSVLLSPQHQQQSPCYYLHSTSVEIEARWVMHCSWGSFSSARRDLQLSVMGRPCCWLCPPPPLAFTRQINIFPSS